MNAAQVISCAAALTCGALGAFALFACGASLDAESAGGSSDGGPRQPGADGGPSDGGVFGDAAGTRIEANGIVLVRHRITEVRENAIAQVLRDVTVVPLDHVRADPLILSVQLTQLLRIPALRQ